MDDLFPRKKKKTLVGLQLAPLIDIFVLIIIFLIKGTVMSNASINIPADLKPAQSKSPEGVEPAGQVYVSPTEVSFSMINDKIALSEMLKMIDGGLDKNEKNPVTQKLRAYIQSLSENDRKSGVLINFLADSSVDYKTVFEISKYCRQIGFQNILFVAQGEK